jgi:hypothetical protein
MLKIKYFFCFQDHIILWMCFIFWQIEYFLKKYHIMWLYVKWWYSSPASYADTARIFMLLMAENLREQE